MTSINEKRLDNFRKHYKSVIAFPSLLQELKFVPSKTVQESQANFCKTFVASRNILQLEQIKFTTQTSESEFVKNLRKCIKNFYADTALASNAIRSEYSYLYFKNSPMSSFFSQLCYESLRYLFFNCCFFELVSESCCIQRSGLYYSDFIWNKTSVGDDSLYLPPPKKKKLEAIDSQRPSPLSYANDGCCSGCFRFRESQLISRAKMLYNRGNRELFTEHLRITREHLFMKIFGMLDHDIRKSLYQGNINKFLDIIINNHRRCKYGNLAKSICFLNKKVNKDQDVLDLAVSHQRIISFLYQVLYFIFPLELFGQRRNFRKVFDRLKLIICVGLKVKFKVSDLRGEEVNLSHCQWLKNLACRHRKLIVFDMFLEWLADYIIKLLRSQFYITESNNYQLFFFPISLWSSMIDKHLNNMVTNGFLKCISAEEVTKQLKLQSLLKSSSIRFIPRKNKLRMINRLRMEGKRFEMQSVLRTLSHFLIKMEKESSSIRFSDNISSLHDAMVIAKKNQLYFIRADIQDCYPSIDQDQLYELVIQRLRSAHFVEKDCIKIRELDVVYCGRIVQKHYSIKETLEEININLNKTFSLEAYDVLVPKKLNTLSMESVKLLFRNYIYLPFIRVGPKRWYQLCKGIRQGGSLSSALCSLYINDILEKVIEDFGSGEKERRLMLEDDMVFITPSIDRARKALYSMINYFPSYGLNINLNKLQFNFDFRQQALGFQEQFTFLGRTICFRDLYIIIDYSKCNDQRLQYSFCCDPFIPMRKAIRNIINQLNLSIVQWDLNCNINREETVALNIYEKSLLQSARFACYLLLSPLYRSQQKPHLIRQFSSNLSKKIIAISEKWSKEETFVFKLSKLEVEWAVNFSLHKIWCLKVMSYRKKEGKIMLNLKNSSSKKISKDRREKFVKFFLNNPNLKITCQLLK